MSFKLYLLYIGLSYLRPIDIFWPELASLRIMALLLVLTLVTSVATAYKNKELATRPAALVLLGLFFVTITLSSISNSMGIEGLFNSLGDFSSSAWFFLLTVLNLTSMERIKKTLWVYVACICIQAILGISSYHYGTYDNHFLVKQTTDVEPYLNESDDPKTPFEDLDGVYLWRIRSLGFLNDPNDFGQAIVMALPLIAIFFNRQKLFTSTLRSAFVAACLLYAIVLTHSRGAILGCAAIVLLYLHKVLGTLKLGILVILVAATMSTISVGGRAISSNEESASQRVDAWWAGIQMFKHQPLLGVGYGNFTNHHNLTAHNSFVLCFAELGSLGYLLWIAMLVVAFRGIQQVVRMAPDASEERCLAELLRYTFVGFMACAIFLSRTYQPGLFLLLGICLSFHWVARKQYDPGAEIEGWSLMTWQRATLATAVATFSMIYAFVVLSGG